MEKKLMVDIRKRDLVDLMEPNFCDRGEVFDSADKTFAKKIRNGLLKITSVFLIVALNATGLLAIGSTFAYFNDQEASNGALQAGVLDFSLSSPADFTPEISATSSNAFRTILLVNDGSLDFDYDISLLNATGTLCSGLEIVAYLDSIQVYEGSLAGFNYLGSMTGTGPSQWDFSASITTTSDASLQNQACYFDFEFLGSQTGEGGGFSDQEAISNAIFSGEWLDSMPDCLKINEVYYDPDETHGSSNDEWIELYNACNYAVNLKDFYLEDKNGQEVIHSNHILNPGQFVLLAANASTWAYWSLIPDNATKIALGGTKLFSGLGNDGDWLALYDSSDNLLDVVAWGEGIVMFSPPVMDVDKGHSIARKVKGVDTDTANDWEDLSLPNPGTNPHSAYTTMTPNLLFSGGVFLNFQQLFIEEPSVVEVVEESKEPAIVLGVETEEEGKASTTDEVVDVVEVIEEEPVAEEEILENPVEEASFTSTTSDEVIIDQPIDVEEVVEIREAEEVIQEELVDDEIIEAPIEEEILRDEPAVNPQDQEDILPDNNQVDEEIE